ncbi:TPA: carbamoyltransferase HypF [Pasteurella multocida]|nr:carbamoyltransferase HypF [Pasteurella multocida]
MEKVLFYGVEIRVKGKVQGVGFRPFVWLLAQKYQFIGDVNNDGEGVLIRLLLEKNDQNQTALLGFLQDLSQQCPPLAHISESIYSWKSWDDLSSTTEFVIRESENSQMDTQIVPDAATCSACLDDLFNPHNRRFHYPFTNCTHCGPRFTIIRKMPYDRPNTSMSHFPFCPTCEKEYKNPADRRFHAQPNACDDCGPHIWLSDSTQILAEKDTALSLTVSYLQQGKIIAVKGIGGFHLACDATNAQAVQLLRQRKQRPTKPLAIMVPSVDWLENLSAEEKQLLQSSAAPIVLLAKEKVPQVCAEIAPNLNEIGVMLPSNPLQHLLLRQIQIPLVMTSANQKGLPPVLDNQKAFKELVGLADYWLLHNRDILQRADDSLVRVAFDGLETLRRARGYVPDELPLNITNKQNILALGADLKNTFCLLKGNKAVVTQHLGDAENEQIQQQISDNIALFQQIYQFAPQKIVVDAHSDYFTRTLGQQLAQQANMPCHSVLHHHAHIMSVLAEHQRTDEKVIGLALDGIGMGENQLWGGECLLVEKAHCQHLGGLPAVAWLGGNLAAKQPWRNLLAHFEQFVPNWQSYPEAEFILAQPWQTLLQAKAKGINAPLVSSAGRLFDAVACALGLHQAQISWEGEAACHLEALAWQYQRVHSETVKSAVYFKEISSLLTANNQIDLAKLWDLWLNSKGNTAKKAWLFHRLFAKAFAELALKQANQHNVQTIVLSGGVCHNQLLRYWLRKDLAQTDVLSAHQYPMGDGGIALGQAVIGAMLGD